VLEDPFMPNRSYGQWLNPAAFGRPAAGEYGTMPLDAIQGSHRWNLDTALSRSFGISGRQVQVRIEAFNLLNTVTAGNPNTTLSSSDFGRVTSAANDPRILQLGIKYQF
jgi:hypothetical protein